VSPNEFVFLLNFGPQVGAVLLQDELGLVSVNQESLLDEEHLQLPGQIGESILKKKNNKSKSVSISFVTL
jgi:hypothetical protein